MHHLERLSSMAPRRGVNRTTALALLAALAVFSALVFFGVANAMLPERSPAAGLGEGGDAAPAGRVPALESPDGSEAVARRLELSGEATEPPTAEVAADGADETDDPRPQPRTTSGQGGGVGRGAADRGGRAVDDEDGRPRSPVRGSDCDPSDPLCGVDFGGGLDA